MVVEINPADVVSVPNDCDCQKLRTCKYKVAALFERKLEEPLCDESMVITKITMRTRDGESLKTKTPLLDLTLTMRLLTLQTRLLSRGTRRH